MSYFFYVMLNLCVLLFVSYVACPMSSIRAKQVLSRDIVWPLIVIVIQNIFLDDTCCAVPFKQKSGFTVLGRFFLVDFTVYNKNNMITVHSVTFF